jgi:hypothetical protein
MATIEVAGQPCLNLVKNKTSYLVVKSDMEMTFDASSKVAVAEGTARAWSGEKYWINKNGTRLKVRLKTEKQDRDVDPPDTGKVTVTITSPDKTLTNVPVDYIADPT